MPDTQEAFHILCFYTLAHPDRDYFIHQHVVDAFHAQTATDHSKPISILYSLIGLYLFLEKGFTGKEVQLAHMQLAKNKPPGPSLSLPLERGTMTVVDVIKLPEGAVRDAGIRAWCQTVWDAYLDWQDAIAAYLLAQGIVPQLN